ncbi:hypothetical protein [[Erwinia] mediterraneensis]|uniref:hypothetical protein n=1 Tax=[Erwinia] mediterraneensis TaxID=2161819 RepID=UPI00102FC474|nr:hypothetical protein [[Erwinia] mediterraneensis]
MQIAKIIYWARCQHAHADENVHIKNKAIKSLLKEVINVSNKSYRAGWQQSRSEIISDANTLLAKANQYTEIINANPHTHNKNKSARINNGKKLLEVIIRNVQNPRSRENGVSSLPSHCSSLAEIQAKKAEKESAEEYLY